MEKINVKQRSSTKKREGSGLREKIEIEET